MKVTITNNTGQTQLIDGLLFDKEFIQKMEDAEAGGVVKKIVQYDGSTGLVYTFEFSSTNNFILYNNAAYGL